MHVANVGPVQNTLRRQDQYDGSNHDLVGNRVEKDTQLRYRPAGPREIAIEIVGNPHEAVQREGNQIAHLPPRPPQEPGKQRNGHDS